MLSRTSEYALRAMVYLAQQAQDGPVPGRQIARDTGIPAKYLSAILSDLVRAGVLTSAPGKKGGFAMARPPDRIKLKSVLDPFESTLGPVRPCPFGNTTCNDRDPCAGHDRWKQVKDAYTRFLAETTLYEVSVQRAAGTGSKKRKRR
ncbi:MAG: Rrf2 family transcriptional regulator [Phycisphaerales bacterium]|nr:MAG: Rrf2 family transcriptional regulator [Phycisphaerales bacterium]